MNNGSDANSALIEYFETLLVDGDAAAVPAVSLDVAPAATALNAARSLPDLGDRSELRGRARPVFRSFEENSLSYLTGRIGKMDRSPTGAVDQSQVRQAPGDVLRVLFFKVAGIPLAVSLEDITGVADIKQMALRRKTLEGGRTIGCFSYRGREIYALDTRETILPHGHPARSDAGKTAYRHIVMLADCECGLLCDEVGGIVNLNRGEIEWREQRQTRPWLAGMVKGHNHAYMDIKEFIGACDRAFSSMH